MKNSIDNSYYMLVKYGSNGLKMFEKEEEYKNFMDQLQKIKKTLYTRVNHLDDEFINIEDGIDIVIQKNPYDDKIEILTLYNPQDFDDFFLNIKSVSISPSDASMLKKFILNNQERIIGNFPNIV